MTDVDVFLQVRVPESAPGAGPALSQTQLDSASRSVDKLEARVESLALACQAMWELLSETCGISTDELQQRMREVDLRDGRRDGKFTPATMTACPSCKQPMKTRRLRCYHCGAELPTAAF